MKFVKKRRQATIVYPPQNEVFNAYKLTHYNDVRVCIVGQDPYINQFEAEGLAFSTFNGQGTPSLKRMEDVIRQQVYKGDSTYKWDNNLKRWAKQGVFLLNTILTVDAGKSLSHQGEGWEWFTLRTIQELDKKGDVVFMLWGTHAKKVAKYIHRSKILTCEHPVAGVYSGKKVWENDDCFNKVNELIEGTKIIW